MTTDLIKSILELFSVVSVTILTILLPVYVIGFSLVGPSATRRKEEMDQINAEEAQVNKEAIEQARNALEKSDTGEARQKLDELENQKIKLERKRKQTETHYSSLNLKHALLVPSALLIVGAVLLKISNVVFEKRVISADLANLWSHILAAGLTIGGFIAIGFALKYISRTLLLIEGLGVRVSEFNRQELRAVLQETLAEWERAKKKEEKEPDVKLSLTWKDRNPPFEVQPEQTLKLRYQVGVTKGYVANDVKILFLLPPGFQFDGLTSWTQGADRGDTAGYITAEKKHGKIQHGLVDVSTITIKSPKEPGTYKAFYRILSDEYGDRDEFVINVK